MFFLSKDAVLMGIWDFLSRVANKFFTVFWFFSSNCATNWIYSFFHSIMTSFVESNKIMEYDKKETYINVAACRNYTNPKIRGAVVFHTQGPQMFDYSIRLNHTWAFSGFPDIHSIMDVNGPYLNDLELGVNPIPIMQYSISGFLTVWFLNPLFAFGKWQFTSGCF